jgi:hypothetical protein
MRLSDYQDEFNRLTAAAALKGDVLDFGQGTWGAREVAYMLGIAYTTVTTRKAGLSNLPAMRIGRSVRYDPQDVIAFRERLHKQAAGRTPTAILDYYRKKKAS